MMELVFYALPYAGAVVFGFAFGWFSRMSKIDSLMKDLAVARAEAAGDEIDERPAPERRRKPVRRSQAASGSLSALPSVIGEALPQVRHDAELSDTIPD